MIMEIATLIVNIILALASVIALIISVISLMKTQKFNRTQLIHNEQNSRPIANIIINDYENKIAVDIENAGNGPLTIVAFKACSGHREASTLFELMPHIHQPYKNFVEEIDGRTIGVAKRLNLIDVAPFFEEDKIALRKTLSTIEIEIVYKDIYDNTYKDSRKLTFFGRHFDNQTKEFKKLKKID